MTVLCYAPKVHLVDAICYARALADKNGKPFFDCLLGVRAEHALANLCGPQALNSCLAAQRAPIPVGVPLHDFVHVGRMLDSKAKWTGADKNLSSYNDPSVAYVFLHPFDSQVRVDHNVDLVYAVDGWCDGGGLERAPAYLRAEFWCPPNKLRAIKELL